MSLCLACAEWITSGLLCPSCRSGLRRTPCFTAADVTVTPAFSHAGPARRLVHRLKYEGLNAIAGFFADALAPLVPEGARALVPVPRARLRKLRYSVDPADEIARALAARTGLPLVRMLRAPMWWPRHAVQDRAGQRNPPSFRRSGQEVPGVVLVDDVATSGATMRAAADALGLDLRHGMAATAPGRMIVPARSEVVEVTWRDDRT